MLIFEAIIDGVRDIKDHLGRTLLQLFGIILGAGSIVATFSLSVAGKEASMKYYRMSGGIERIWVGNKPTGKVTLDAKALASDGLTFADAMALREEGKEIDLGPKTTSFRDWAMRLRDHAAAGGFDHELDHWVDVQEAWELQLTGACGKVLLSPWE